jgi:hypothetical protein
VSASSVPAGPGPVGPVATAGSLFDLTNAITTRIAEAAVATIEPQMKVSSPFSHP